MPSSSAGLPAVGFSTDGHEGNQWPYLAQAYASTRGSAAALNTPVFGSIAMAAFEPNDHGFATRSS